MTTALAPSPPPTAICLALMLAGCGGTGLSGLEDLEEGAVTTISGPLTEISAPVTVAPRYAEMFFTEHKTKARSVGPTGPDNALLLDIDPGAGSVAVRDLVVSDSFAIDFDDDSRAFATDTVGIDPDTRTLSLLVPGAASGYSYVSYGVWQSIYGLCCDATAIVRAFYFGNPSATGTIPANGQAVFSGTMQGYYSPASQSLVALAGDASLTVNFGTHRLTGSFYDIVATTVLGPGIAGYPDILVDATLSGNRISGEVTGGPAGSSGDLLGNLFGPGASEMGGVFQMDGNGQTIGAFAAKR